jgi:hypothetical protein
MNPCKKGSARAALFEYLQKPRTLSRFKAKAETLGVDPSRTLRFFRHGIFSEDTGQWILDETPDGKIQMVLFGS